MSYLLGQLRKRVVVFRSYHIACTAACWVMGIGQLMASAPYPTQVHKDQYLGVSIDREISERLVDQLFKNCKSYAGEPLPINLETLTDQLVACLPHKADDFTSLVHDKRFRGLASEIPTDLLISLRCFVKQYAQTEKPNSTREWNKRLHWEVFKVHIVEILLQNRCFFSVSGQLLADLYVQSVLADAVHYFEDFLGIRLYDIWENLLACLHTRTLSKDEANYRNYVTQRAFNLLKYPTDFPLAELTADFIYTETIECQISAACRSYNIDDHIAIGFMLQKTLFIGHDSMDRLAMLRTMLAGQGTAYEPFFAMLLHAVQAAREASQKLPDRQALKRLKEAPHPLQIHEQEISQLTAHTGKEAIVTQEQKQSLPPTPPFRWMPEAYAAITEHLDQGVCHWCQDTEFPEEEKKANDSQERVAKQLATVAYYKKVMQMLAVWWRADRKFLKFTQPMEEVGSVLFASQFGQKLSKKPGERNLILTYLVHKLYNDSCREQYSKLENEQVFFPLRLHAHYCPEHTVDPDQAFELTGHRLIHGSGKKTEYELLIAAKENLNRKTCTLFLPSLQVDTSADMVDNDVFRADLLKKVVGLYLPYTLYSIEMHIIAGIQQFANFTRRDKQKTDVGILCYHGAFDKMMGFANGALTIEEIKKIFPSLAKNFKEGITVLILPSCDVGHQNSEHDINVAKTMAEVTKCLYVLGPWRPCTGLSALLPFKYGIVSPFIIFSTDCGPQLTCTELYAYNPKKGKVDTFLFDTDGAARIMLDKFMFPLTPQTKDAALRAQNMLKQKPPIAPERLPAWAAQLAKHLQCAQPK